MFSVVSNLSLQGCQASMFCSTVDYFTSNRSTISIASLDVAQAFEKVNHCALLLKLMKRQVPVCLIRLLADW